MDELAGHYRRYTRNSIAPLLCNCGYRIEDIRYFNPLGGIGWLLNTWFAKPKGLSDPLVNRQILFFDRWVSPVSRFLDPLTRRWFGQSVLAVARPQEGRAR
jgi:hypothetical protein